MSNKYEVVGISNANLQHWARCGSAAEAGIKANEYRQIFGMRQVVITSPTGVMKTWSRALFMDGTYGEWQQMREPKKLSARAR